MEITTNRILILADKLTELRDQKGELTDQLKDVNSKIEELNETMVEIMINEEMPSFKRSGRTFFLNTRTFASPKGGQREAMHNWLKENGFADLIKETVHSSTLSSFAKEYIDENDELPEDLAEVLNVYDKISVGVRRG